MCSDEENPDEQPEQRAEQKSGDFVAPPLTLNPDREQERVGLLRCHRCGRPARWLPWGDAWVPACQHHAPEDDNT